MNEEQGKEMSNQGEPTNDGYEFWADQAANHLEQEVGQTKETEQPKKDSSQEENTSTIYRMSKEQIPKDYDAMDYQTSYSTTYSSEADSNAKSNIDSNKQFRQQAQQEKKRRKSKKKMEQGNKKIISFIGAAFLFGLIAGFTFLGVNWIAGTFNQQDDVVVEGREKEAEELDIKNVEDEEGKENEDDPGVEERVEKTTVSSGTTLKSSDVSEVVENSMPSIVTITSTISQSYSFFGKDYSEDGQGSGSGIIVGQSNKELLVATNNHVVEGAKKIGVTFIDDEVVEAKIKGTNKAADLAVISIDLTEIKKSTLKSIKVATLGNSDNIKVGQMAIAIGNALGYGQSVTVGYISAKDRVVSVSGTPMVLLQTDAAINPGNSGGALLNVNGEVIGINSVKYAASEVEGMGYAIPITKAIPIINVLMNRESIKDDEKGYLGISGTDVTQEDSEKYKMPMGVYVNDVAEEGAAKEAGIRPGDIIIKIADTKVNTMVGLQESVNSYRVGTKVEITIMRNKLGSYKEKVVSVTLKGSKSLDGLMEEEEKQDSEQQYPEQQNPEQENPEQENPEDDFDIRDWFMDPYFWD